MVRLRCHVCGKAGPQACMLQGGKTAQPILREDVLLQKMPRVRKPQNEAPDAFVPEYSQDNWYKQHTAGSSRHASQV